MAKRSQKKDACYHKVKSRVQGFGPAHTLQGHFLSVVKLAQRTGVISKRKLLEAWCFQWIIQNVQHETDAPRAA